MRCLAVIIAAGAALAAACTSTAPPSDMPAADAADPDSESERPAGLMQWSDLLGRAMPEPDQSIQIGPDPEIDTVDLWLPEGEGPHPTVLMIHGGCWQKSIADRTLMNYAADALRDEGFAVWNVEYRGVDEEGGGYPGTFENVANAADALAARGRDFGLDTSRVAAFGHSAGGHLAVWTAARATLPETSPLYSDSPLELAGVVNSGGLADLEASAPVTAPTCLANIMDMLTGAPTADRPDVFSDTSPAEFPPLDTRIISVNGAQDRIAPPELGRGLTEMIREAGGEADYVNVPASGHVELVAPGTLAFDMQIAALKQLLGDPAAASD